MEIFIYILTAIAIISLVIMTVYGGPMYGIVLIVFIFSLFVHKESWNREVNYSELTHIIEMEVEDECLNYYFKKLKNEAFVDGKLSNYEFVYIDTIAKEQMVFLAKEKIKNSLEEFDSTPSDSCINPRWSLEKAYRPFAIFG
jgi:hypothetical protein